MHVDNLQHLSTAGPCRKFAQTVTIALHCRNCTRHHGKEHTRPQCLLGLIAQTLLVASDAFGLSILKIISWL